MSVESIMIRHRVTNACIKTHLHVNKYRYAYGNENF